MTMMLRRGGGVEDGICGRTESSCVVPEIDWDRDLKTGLWLMAWYWLLGTARDILWLYVGSCGFVFVGGGMMTSTSNTMTT